MLVDVVIPEGLNGGDEMHVETEAGISLVMIPKNLSSGDLLTVEVEPEQAQNTEALYVVVPDDINEGQTFTVETLWGGLFDVTCPPGCSSVR